MTDLCLTINAAAKPIELGAIGIGIKGADGLSAYEVAVKNGFEGTEQEWANSLGGSYTLPVATQTLLGGIMVGENLKIVGGVLSVDTTALQTYVDAVILGVRRSV